MQVKLVSITRPTVVVDGNVLSPEAFMIYCARVSSPNQENSNYEKLLEYCIRKKHWSVFEQVNMGVEITTSRAIAPQILRHKSFSFQEFSQRYANITVFFEDVELRLQGDSKQGSSEVVQSHYYENRADEVMGKCEEFYRELLYDGISRETARMYLPQCTKTKIYMNGTVRSWIHYLQIRLAQETQKEHRLIAQEILLIFKVNFPIITKLLFESE
jgi:thymidylate synthase (FAD)